VKPVAGGIFHVVTLARHGAGAPGWVREAGHSLEELQKKLQYNIAMFQYQQPSP
jgi:hypothetical protein